MMLDVVPRPTRAWPQGPSEPRVHERGAPLVNDERAA
jgi:hypothetical protein